MSNNKGETQLFLARPLLGLIITIALLLSFSTQVFACECATPTPEEELSKADIVFAGKVTAIRKDFFSSFYLNTTFPFAHKNYQFTANVTFETSRNWKGAVGQEIQLKSSFGGWCYNRNFELGKEYLVFAYNNQNGLRAGGCSNTGLLTSKEQTVLKLGQGERRHSVPSKPSLFPTDYYQSLLKLFLQVV